MPFILDWSPKPARSFTCGRPTNSLRAQVAHTSQPQPALLLLVRARRRLQQSLPDKPLPTSVPARIAERPL